jgi:hypothetical protein
MENVTAILTSALKNLPDTELVAINARTARQIGLRVEPAWADDRPVEVSAAAIRSAIQSPTTEPEDDGADL